MLATATARRWYCVFIGYGGSVVAVEACCLSVVHRAASSTRLQELEDFLEPGVYYRIFTASHHLLQLVIAFSVGINEQR